MNCKVTRSRNNNFKFARLRRYRRSSMLVEFSRWTRVNPRKGREKKEILKEDREPRRRWKEKEKEKGRRTKSTVSSNPPTAGWQRLNDLPNNKSSGRYDRMQRGPSLGTSEPLTSPYLSAKASTYSIPFGAPPVPLFYAALPKHFEFPGHR